jgi:hypothetical protein
MVVAKKHHFPTINMESFEDSPDADRHGENSIPRELVAEKWRSRQLQPRTRPSLCEQRNTRAPSEVLVMLPDPQFRIGVEIGRFRY